MTSKDAYHGMKLALARNVAIGANPTAAKFSQTFLEEFGEPPTDEMIGEFQRIRKEVERNEVTSPNFTAPPKSGPAPDAPPADPVEKGALRAVLKAAFQAAVAVTDPSGLITAFSSGASRMFGHQPDAVLGQGIAQLFLPAELDVYAKVVSSEMERQLTGFEALTVRTLDGRPNERDWTLVRKDGKKLAARVAVASLRDVSRVARGFVFSVTDITALKMAQKDLASARRNEEEALSRQAELLERLSTAVRTPLNSVLGFADILAENRLDPTQADQARSIGKNARELLAVIDGLLNASRMEAGELDLIQTEFDPEGIILAVAESFGVKAAAKGLSLSFQVDPGIPEVVSGDPDRFRQVVSNLVGNAVRFTESGEIRVLAESQAAEAERIKIKISVADTGIGIPKERLGGVFQPSAKPRLQRSADEAGDISLAYCRHIALLMGGDLTVSSREGAGSTFSFTAWLGRVPDAEKMAQPPKLLTGKKILVVDDSERNVESLTKILSTARMRVVPIMNGLEVVPTLQRAREAGNPLDLVLCDLAMPGMDGYEVGSQIRLLGGDFARLPLVAIAPLTGLDAQKSAKAGFDEVMTSPIRKAALYEVLARLLTRGSVVSTSAGRPVNSLRILLAEDNPDNHKLAKFILTKAGHEVDGAMDGEQAVKMVLESHEGYDLILMDVEMPKMDGFAAVKMIRKDGFTDIPIIALTAHAMPEDRERCLAAGMNDYISKPLKKENLIRMVEKYGKTLHS